MPNLMDAAERLLIAEGYASLSTRRVAEEARVNHGLVHYYFGSMDELVAQVLDRFTQRLIDRQQEMYAQDMPFIEKWRAAIGYLQTDAASGYHKLWFELQAMSWNTSALRERVKQVNAAWRRVLTEALESAVAEHHLDTRIFPIPAIVSLVMTFNQGIILERLSGVTDGQDDLLQAIDRWLSSLAERG